MKAAQCGGRGDETSFGGLGPPTGALPLSSGPVSSDASEVLNTPTHTLNPPQPPPPLPFGVFNVLCMDGHDKRTDFKMFSKSPLNQLGLWGITLFTNPLLIYLQSN